MTTSRTAKATTRMTREELARTWAAQEGITGRTGGWLYTANGTPVVHGWTALADYLVGRGLIREGLGIDWRSTHLAGGGQKIALAARGARLARTAR